MSKRAAPSHPRRVLSPEYALLGLLTLAPSHGYDLHQKLTTDLGNVWHVSQSQAYSILKRLEERGDVSARAERKGKLPRRQVLHITTAGKKRFREWLDGAASSGARTVRLEFLTRLYFANLIRPARVNRIYQAQEREIATAIRRLRLMLSQVSEEQVYNRLSLDLRLRQMELVRSWLHDARTKFHVKPEAEK
ncbi:MAG TPA: PadR family transcriptional regulator [Anaerolineales bacterium]|nr:PadR family transcriptional regulator [Anaerolineales bacterium]